MTATVIRGDGPLRDEVRAGIEEVTRDSDGRIAVACWDLPGGAPLDADALDRALMSGMHHTAELLHGPPADRLVHLVHTAGDSPVEQALQGFVSGFTKSLARELARGHVTVNAAGSTGAVAGVDRFVETCRFLSGPRAAFVTGQCFGTAGQRLAQPGAAGPRHWPAGRSVMVSGGAGAIGAAICRALAADGWKVDIGHVRTEPATRLSAELDDAGWANEIVPLDLEDPASIDRVERRERDRHPEVGGLVLCGGWNRTEKFAAGSVDAWRKTITVNLTGPARLASAVVRHWDAGIVVGIGSEAGRVGDSGRAVYAGAKAGLAAMLAAMNASGADLRAATVSPGPIDTPLMHETFGSPERAARGMAKLEALVPVGRLGAPEEVADAVRFVFSPAGAPFGGELISVGGGVTMQ